MSYQELTTIPPYESIRWEEGKMLPVQPGNLKWGKDEAPPAIGASIIVTINSCGPAIVTGYFEQDGYLGVRCRLLNAPDWHKRQNKGNPNGHVFGPEYRLDTASAEA